MVFLVLLIFELKIIVMTSNKFVNQNTLTYIQYHRMGQETFSIFCDGPWNFVEEFRMGHQNVWGNIIFRSLNQLCLSTSKNLQHTQGLKHPELFWSRVHRCFYSRLLYKTKKIITKGVDSLSRKWTEFKKWSNSATQRLDHCVLVVMNCKVMAMFNCIYTWLKLS